MAKGQMRSNKEQKKPKQPKKPAPVPMNSRSGQPGIAQPGGARRK